MSIPRFPEAMGTNIVMGYFVLAILAKEKNPN
jgi:hypothetical protein